MRNIIELKNISRTYCTGSQALRVLNSVTMTIASGEMVAIIGSSGSGKSTLLNIMGCLDVPDSGDYFLGGQNVARLSPDELAKVRREHVGFIFQRYHLMPDLSALDNVEIPAIYAGIRRVERRFLAASLLEKLGLKGREHHKPGELSGGQQQRVSIARALINGGEVILADEPTGALDVRSGQEVLAILNELNQRGHTVVIVTHDMQVASHARRIIELRDGEIISDSGSYPASTEAQLVHSRNRQKPWLNALDRSRESLRMALKAMNGHRLRTILTMVGIIFGIASVVSVMALGEGAKQRVLENISELGTNVINIYPGRHSIYDSTDKSRALVTEDADALMKQTFTDSVSPEITLSDNIRFLDKSASALINGVGRDYFHVMGIKILEGVTFSDDRHALQEIIIDENTRKVLFDERGLKALGQIIFLGPVPLRVVGIAQSNNRSYAPDSINVWMPYSAVMYRMTGKPDLSSISVRLKDDYDNVAAVSLIDELLTQRHGVKNFHLFNAEQVKKSIKNTATTLNILNLLIACISLLTGSIGVMNIMLVSVTERTHEIGVRMATGARQNDIMQQFMLEALLVCLSGGILGIALSYIAAPLLNLLAGERYTAIYSWQAAAIAFLCSTLIGMIFGYLPACKAARMNPVASLASD